MKSSRPISGLRVAIPAGLLALSGCRHRAPKATALPAAEPATAVGGSATFEEVVLTKFSEKERLWILVPKDGHVVHPCVFLAAEGEDVYHGARLNEKARPGYLQYARAGYTVVAYDVSGAPPAIEDAEKAAASVRLFAKRDVGTLNGKAAIDYALHHLRVDPIRLYVAGHGAAGTLALQMAALDSRIRGCIAYAPIVSGTNETPYAEDEIGYAAPEALRTIRKFSLAATAPEIQCPVMLFFAKDENGSRPAAIQEYARSLASHGHEVDVTNVPPSVGGAYGDEEGVSAGIEWLGRARRKAKSFAGKATKK